MQDEHFSEEKSLALIGSMINKARNQFTENGYLYLLWGWVVLVCSVSHFLLQHVFHIKYYYLTWMLTWPTAIYQIIYLRRKIKSSQVRTYTDEIIGYVWLLFFICTVLLIVLLIGRFTNPGYQTVIWLVMYGMPTFLSGTIIRYKGLIVGAICCWVLAILSSFVPLQYHMLLLSAAIVCGWIIPGYGMQQKFNKQNAIAL
jgi:hypothetical protein